MNPNLLCLGNYIAHNGKICLVHKLDTDHAEVIPVADMVTGKEISHFPIHPKYGEIDGLRTYSRFDSFGFHKSTKRGWQWIYYWGNGYLLLRWDNIKLCLALRYYPDNTRKNLYIRINVLYMHELQNIMRFLTGGEMDFEYKYQNN